MIPCVDCPDVVFETQEAIIEHRRVVHPPPKPWTERPETCRGTHGGRRKKHYGKLHKAWVGAWLTFARNGFILTPYKCKSAKVNGRATQETCSGWHLTHSTRHCLPK